jgi:hypothetical protein
MSEQQSGKSGVASTSRKQDSSKHGVEAEPIPATQPVAGAFAAEDAPPTDEIAHATAGRGTDDVGPARRSRRNRRQPEKSR